MNCKNYFLFHGEILRSAYQFNTWIINKNWEILFGIEMLVYMRSCFRKYLFVGDKGRGSLNDLEYTSE